MGGYSVFVMVEDSTRFIWDERKKRVDLLGRSYVVKGPKDWGSLAYPQCNES